jgi:MoxR-like ATPase
LYLQKQISQIVASPFIITYVTRLVRATRPKDAAAPDFIKRLVDWGAGPRAGQNLVNGAKAFAAMDGRPNVSIADVRKVAIPVLRHRIATNFQAQAEGLDIDEIITKLIAAVPEPNIPKYER